MNDVIRSNHSSVLEGTDVDFSEALENSPSLPYHQHSSFQRDASTDSSSSMPACTPSDALHPDTSALAVAQLITTADDDWTAEHAALRSCPDLLVFVQPLHRATASAMPTL